MKTFFKNIGNTIVKKLRKHPLICNFVLSVVLAFILEVLGRPTILKISMIWLNGHAWRTESGRCRENEPTIPGRKG